MKNKIKKASKLRQLDVAMDECTCYQCGAGTVETYEIEGTYRDAKTLKPFNQYQRVTWQSLGDDEYDFYHKSSIHYDDYAETTDGMVFKFKASEIGWLPVIIGFAVYLVLLILHETFFGIAPMSWVSGLFH